MNWWRLIAPGVILVALQAGCSSQASDPACVGKIKGNINDKGERIYHKPGQAVYKRTNPERWFCTEDEAKKAGFRRSKV